MSDSDEDGRDFCIKNNMQCIRCKNRACNSHQLEFEKPLSCIKCTPNENCNIIDKNVTGMACNRTTIGYKNSCYTHQIGSHVTRGCLYEANDQIFDICQKNQTDFCALCDQADCNREPAKNATIPPLILNDFVFESDALYDEVIPLRAKENRLHCYQCNGTDECDFISKPNSVKPNACPISSTYDQCYTFIHKGWIFLFTKNPINFLAIR